MTQPFDLDAVLARLDLATPGPWAVYRHPLELTEEGAKLANAGAEDYENRIGTARDDPQLGRPYPVVTWVHHFYALPEYGIRLTDADADLIAHAPTDLAAACDEIERLRAALAFYADESNYGYDDDDNNDYEESAYYSLQQVEEDRGAIARAALSPARTEETAP